ncbi:MAG: hypothetical protein HOD72_09815 [Opitutae bacterium]|nr:hypothetical protein [Opitutae bacterium]
MKRISGELITAQRASSMRSRQAGRNALLGGSPARARFSSSITKELASGLRWFDQETAGIFFGQGVGFRSGMGMMRSA